MTHAAKEGSEREMAEEYIDVMEDRTPLMIALSTKNKDQIASLLDRGEDMNFMWTRRVAETIRRGRSGTSICRYLIEMAIHYDLEMVKFVLDLGARLDISSALHVAASNCCEDDEPERVKIIEFLLEKGMDINKLEFATEQDFPKKYTTRAYRTLLHYAACWGMAGVVECLLKHGADPNIQAACYRNELDANYGTPLDWQKFSEPDEGTYSRRVLVLLGVKDKL